MTPHLPPYRPLPVLCALVAGDVPWREAEVPAGVVRIEVVGLVQDRLVYRGGDGRELTTSLPPSACLGLFATAASLALMQQVRDWLVRQGAADLPAVMQVDGEAAALMRVLLARLAAEAEALAEVASSYARQVAVLRGEVETLATIRADLDRFIGDVGLARLVCVFATGDPDFETQIELTPGAALRQLLPVASTGVAGVALAVAASERPLAPLRVRLVALEDGATLAQWRVASPREDGWVRLGLPRALDGMTRTLALVVDSASADIGCANLALGGHQALVPAQLSDEATGESVAPHSLALRIFSALPGTTPPHPPGTVTPDPAELVPAPFALRAVPREVLAGIVSEPPPPEGTVPDAIFMSRHDAALCRAGRQGRIPGGCPAGARGVLLRARVQAGVPRTHAAWFGVDEPGLAPEAEPDPALWRQVTLDGETLQEVSILFAEPLAEPRDLLIASEPPAQDTDDAVWIVIAQLQAYL
ncbi:hypothetical protein VQ03_20185 [Methylobacterium tarhaniae]|uniref:Uncharacterized protein n=1 Tax=Methylobacterium tarhaniae TaxID=1187852 RepID=A0A0J6STI7_9HYPH|nr:DUF6212 domain-containing protein [Methylobacterium tarhaniae]KMO36683.1 hypothetical protein VQ03_20185 [Methylobacterium tarhaniae]